MLFLILFFIQKIYHFYYVEACYKNTTYFVLMLELKPSSTEGFLLKAECKENATLSDYNTFLKEFYANNESDGNYQKLLTIDTGFKIYNEKKFDFNLDGFELTLDFVCSFNLEDSFTCDLVKRIYYNTTFESTKTICLDGTPFRDDPNFIGTIYSRAKRLYNSSESKDQKVEIVTSVCVENKPSDSFGSILVVLLVVFLTALLGLWSLLFQIKKNKK